MTTSYTRQTLEAVQLFGTEISQARRERRWTSEELAERAGIGRTTLWKIERGDPSVAIGTVFEVATLVGLPLFGVEASDLGALVRSSRDRLSLLPSRVREPSEPVHDDF